MLTMAVMAAGTTRMPTPLLPPVAPPPFGAGRGTEEEEAEGLGLGAARWAGSGGMEEVAGREEAAEAEAEAA